MHRIRPASYCLPPLLLAALMFFWGIGWGLPSRAVDPFLFGNRTPWTGQKIMALAGNWGNDANRGADVDANPILDRSHLIPLNQTDAQRAEIVRRYRLYSYQPDEWITIKSLAMLKSHHGDPRVYQYGGLWIYPVGALLKLASLPPLHYITLHPDPAFYLDHPALFGRFYVIARAYSALWGLAGVVAVFALLRQWQVRPLLAMAAAALFALMPVVVNMAHEAKPHLAGAVLLLWAIFAACRYVEHGNTRAWVWAGLLCGAALGMVLSSLLGFILLPLMLLLRPLPWTQRLRRLLLALLLALAVYAVTNPYVFINALTHREILASNLGTSTAMYPLAGLASGVATTLDLIGEGASRPLAVGGLAGALALAWAALKKMRRDTAPLAPSGAPSPTNTPPPAPHSPALIQLWLLAAPALVILGAMAALGAGKPGEFGRFGLLPDIALLLLTVMAVDFLVPGGALRGALVLILLGSTTFWGGLYLRGFIRDSLGNPARLVQAAALRRLAQAGNDTMALTAEPAPYSLPPVNLFDWKLLLLPRDGALRSDELLPDVIVRMTDRPPTAQTSALLLYAPVPDPTPHSRYQPRISWADKPLDIRLRRHRAPGTSHNQLAEIRNAPPPPPIPAPDQG